MIRSRTALGAMLTLSLLIARAVLVDAAFPVSTEFQVNTYTTDSQYGQVVAMDGAGNFVVAWVSFQDGSDLGVMGRRFDSTGVPLGGEFQVNTYTTGTQRNPAIAADGAGNFVVVWNSYGQDGSSSGVFGQRYDSAGTPVGGQFQVNTYTTSGQYYPAVAGDGAGNFVVVWESLGQDGSSSGVFGQRYNNAGVALGGEFQVNSYTTGTQFAPAAAIDGAGNFVVVWESRQGGPDYDIIGRRYDSAGLPLGGEFQVNTYTTGAQRAADVAATAGGSFVVVWTSEGQDGSDYGIFGQRYDGAGVPLGGEFQVNTYTTGTQFEPAVAVDGAGNFVVVWQSDGQDGSGWGVFGQRYDSTGLRLGGEFQENSSTNFDQREPAVAADGAGNFVVVWVNFKDGSNLLDVFGQRNKPDRRIRGTKLQLGNPTGNESDRTVIVLGRETTTEIGTSIDGDPTMNGATLRLIANGTTNSDQTYVLDASGWRPLGTSGFVYSGPTGADADPVRRLTLTRMPHGVAKLKAVIRGDVGTQSLDVVPPNTGDDGGVILQIGNGGGRYCVGFGGAAGGAEVQDTAQGWKVIKATAEPGCPSP